MPKATGSGFSSAAQASITTPMPDATRSKLPIRGRRNIGHRASVVPGKSIVSVTYGNTRARPLTDTQKAAMVAAIPAHLRGWRGGKSLVDSVGGTHLRHTIESLVVRGVLARSNHANASGRAMLWGLTEVGMLAALWLEQEATEGI